MNEDEQGLLERLRHQHSPGQHQVASPNAAQHFSQPPLAEPFHQQLAPEAPSYFSVNRPQPLGFVPTSSSTSYPGFAQTAQQPIQGPEPTQPNTQSAAPILPQQPPYNLPMSPSQGNSNENRTASLLQLLKFSQPVPASEPTSDSGLSAPAAPVPPRPLVNSPPPASVPDPTAHNRAISATDLVASIFSRPPPDSATSVKENGPPGSRQSPVQQRIPPESLPREKSPVNAKDLVFQLLARPKPSHDAQGPDKDPSLPAPPLAPAAADAEESAKKDVIPQEEPPAEPQQFEHRAPSPGLRSSPTTPQDNQLPSKGMFSYVNPFEQLSATSPRNRTPKSATPGPGAGRKSGLGLNEWRAENIPLPYTPSPTLGSGPASPPASTEADVSKDIASPEQVKEKERSLMEQLGQHIESAPSSLHTLSKTDAQQSDRIASDTNERRPSMSQAEPQPDTTPQAEGTVIPGVGKPDITANQDDTMYDSSPENRVIEVYNFPMKPFSSIAIIPSAIRRPKYPISKISDIARMNRTFDQLDRNLISASHNFIVYASSKSNNRGGIRIIHQYDGKDRVLMKDSGDRTFNVTIGKGERILGTGVSGAVIYANLMEDFETDSWDSMFVFPPSEEQGQSNGVLKSRARKTFRHMDVFAIGRGKTINIIYAPAAKAYTTGQKGSEVLSKKYLTDHARMVDTGKASKDFTFSDDDTVIISIDKAGKLKFWDVQDMLNFMEHEAYDLVSKTFAPQPPMVLSTPILIYSAVTAGESYRATSVMFLDKFRPYLKCLALRYVIVGMKQNHTLQLWDLALGRPVQEINFPQESDTDALCSVVYHPLSGIIVVGNPTRNSIYFIHLSAPKYNLPTMTQAQYIQCLANKDPSIPKPDATAILSGLREYSFAHKGKLMSLDILDSESDGQDDSPTLFELYVAHSKGMTTLSVHKEDLGWEADNRVKHPVDAVQRGACTISNMPPPPAPEKERDDKSETTEPPSTLKPKSEKTDKSRSVSPSARAGEKADTADDKSAINHTSSKKKRKEKQNATAVQSAVEPLAHGADEAKAEKNVPGKGKATVTQPIEPEISTVTSALDREIKRLEKSIPSEIYKILGKELDQLYQKFDDDRRSQQAASDAKQDAILRLLSTTLTENVEQVISRIVMTNIQSQVVPAVSDVAARSVDRVLGESLSHTLSLSLPNELHQIVPDAVNRVFGQPELFNRAADTLTRPIAQAVERELSHLLHTSLIPSFQRLALETAQKAVIETERRHNDAIAQLERLHRQDSAKIDQLMAMMKSMSETMAGMANSQADFQESIKQATEDYYKYGAPTTESPRGAPAPKTAEQLEAEEIEGLLRGGRYEDGTIKWLQSKERQAELFDEVMVRYRYDFLPNLSQLVLLSVSAAVSVQFDNKVVERLSWLEGVLAVLDPMDPEIHEICQRIMMVVVQRLEQLYMSTAESNPQNPILRKITGIARRARELATLSARE